MEMFGNTKIAQLQTFLDLPNGIPTHDTFNRFFSAVDPNEFENCFLDWINLYLVSERTEFTSSAQLKPQRQGVRSVENQGVCFCK